MSTRQHDGRGPESEIDRVCVHPRGAVAQTMRVIVCLQNGPVQDELKVGQVVQDPKADSLENATCCRNARDTTPRTIWL